MLTFLVFYDSITIDIDGLGDGTIDLLYLLCDHDLPFPNVISEDRIKKVISEDRIRRNEPQILPITMFDQASIKKHHTLITKEHTLHHVKTVVLDEDKIPHFFDSINASTTDTKINKRMSEEVSKRLDVALDGLEISEIDDDVSIFLKAKFYKEVQSLPPLPIAGKNNKDWVTLSGFKKSNNVPETTVRAIFSPRRKSITVEHNGCKYGKSQSKGWKGLVWCQMPEEMKPKQNYCGYFLLRESLPEKYKKTDKQ